MPSDLISFPVTFQVEYFCVESLRDIIWNIIRQLTIRRKSSVTKLRKLKLIERIITHIENNGIILRIDKPSLRSWFSWCLSHNQSRHLACNLHKLILRPQRILYNDHLLRFDTMSIISSLFPRLDPVLQLRRIIRSSFDNPKVSRHPRKLRLHFPNSQLIRML